MRNPSLLLVALLGACGGGSTSMAPTPVAPGGATSITATDVARRIGIIADDSMLGRATPSHGLEMTAGYAAAEFRRLGLRPAGEGGSYLQRYPLIISRFDPAKSWVRATGRAAAQWQVGPDLPLMQGEPSGDVTGAGLVLLVGDSSQGVMIPPGAVTGKIVVVVFGPAVDGIAGALVQQKPAGVFLVAAMPDGMWSKMPGKTASIRVVNPAEGGLAIPPVFAVRRGAFTPWLARAGVDTTMLDAHGPMHIVPAPGVAVDFHVDQQRVSDESAPNVMGVLEGSDPTLKNEYVLFSGHMDHIGTPGSGEGCSALGGDSICNGADDDGSGSVTVLELAEAFATAPVRPKRSVAFLLVSGEERGLWGSGYWAGHPTLPIANIVADLNIDMVGRNAPDTLSVIGREHSDLSATLDQVAARHPELGLHAMGDLWPSEGLYFRSDHFNFARKGIPILFFTTGLHPQYHAVTDEPSLIDNDKAARIGRLIYYLGETIANTPARPAWDPASRTRIVESAPAP